MPLIGCSTCTERFDTMQDAIAHDCDGDDPIQQRATDGGLTLDGEPKARVQFSSGGVQFYSEPMDTERARAYADNLDDAVVKVESGERPLCDDEQAVVVPEVADDR